MVVSSKSIWEAYQVFSSTSAVRRKGYELTGMTASTSDNEPDVAESFALRGESDLEHQAKVAWLVMAMYAAHFEDFFIFPDDSDENIWMYLTLALCHDVGEVSCGDIPDDGNPLHDAKDMQERVVFYMMALNTFDSVEEYCTVSEAFCHFQDKDCHNGKALYALDKLEAVLTQLFYEKHGRFGSITAKKEPTDMDKYFMLVTGSNLSSDCWAAHFYTLIRDYPESIKNPLLDLLNVAVCDVRGVQYDWWGKDFPPYV